jgi:hypothetical protein
MRRALRVRDWGMKAREGRVALDGARPEGGNAMTRDEGPLRQ